MVELHFYNTFVKITGADKLLAQMISDRLSFEPLGSDHIKRNLPSYMKDKWDCRKRLLDKRKMTFPAGLVNPVIKLLKEESIPYKITNMRSIPVSTSKYRIIADVTPRYYQEDLREITRKYSRGVALMATSAGKTLSSALIIEDKGVDTLFVTPDTGLREQTISVFKGLFGKELVSHDIKSEKPIIVSNIQSLCKKSVSELERFRMIIIDEMHHSSSNQYLELNAKTPMAYYRYGLTGTFVRPDGTDMIMHGVLSSVIYKKSATELIDEGWIVRPHITVYEYPLKGWSKLNYKEAYEKMIMDRDFNLFISDVASKCIRENRQTIILVRRKEHGSILNSMIDDSVYISGDDKTNVREQIKSDFNNKKIKCLIATSVMGEGQDIPNIDVLINARLQESEIQTKQGIGRALRLAQGAKNITESIALGKEKCEVYDFLITGQRHLKAHSLSRLQHYRSEPAFKVTVCKI